MVGDPQAEEERTTARGLARYAYEYLEAAILVDETIGARAGGECVSPIPAYYLASHSIELTLKAFLRHRGLTVRELRLKYGHSLKACYRKAKELGLFDVFRQHENDEAALHLLAEINNAHELRYIRTGFKTFPSWAIVEPFAVRLHQAVAPLVGYKSFTKSYAAHAAPAAQ
ncbi:MAG: hypothetical protein KJ011_05025 [Burkholderiaceae bacterium]|nr:hypothetical protein [Burkholderiaceae bacterium]